MAPPPLMDVEELVEEILLRFPPHEPALLVRASLVCKRWCCLISGPGFRRRFRELHRTPPILALLYRSSTDLEGGFVSCFAPTAAFCSPHAESRRWRALDARHGRVLRCTEGRLYDYGVIVVWDPITGEKRKLPPLLRQYMSMRNAAVLCSAGAGACDHLDCHAGPFLVVAVGSYRGATVVCT
ncbi:unnamed protein product [Urochloa humidicola]